MHALFDTSIRRNAYHSGFQAVEAIRTLPQRIVFQIAEQHSHHSIISACVRTACQREGNFVRSTVAIANGKFIITTMQRRRFNSTLFPDNIYRISLVCVEQIQRIRK